MSGPFYIDATALLEYGLFQKQWSYAHLACSI